MRSGERGGRWRALLLALCLLAPAARAAPPRSWNIDTLLGAVKRGAPETVHYREVKTMPALAVPLHLSGTLAYTPPDRLEKRVDPPYAESYLIAGEEVTYRRGDSVRHLDLGEYPPLAALAAALRGVLGGDPALLRRYYRLRLKGRWASWTLALTPRQGAMRQHVEAMEVAGEGRRLVRFSIYAPNGEADTLTFDGPPR